MATILIGCRLPNGLILHHPNPKLRDEVKPVRIKGIKESKIIGAPYITTEVDEEFWQAWKKIYSRYQPVTSGAIFEASSAAEAKAKGTDLKDEKTGFEPIAPESMGVKSADKE